jgi:hypothetical protein
MAFPGILRASSALHTTVFIFNLCFLFITLKTPRGQTSAHLPQPQHFSATD